MCVPKYILTPPTLIFTALRMLNSVTLQFEYHNQHADRKKKIIMCSIANQTISTFLRVNDKSVRRRVIDAMAGDFGSSSCSDWLRTVTTPCSDWLCPVVTSPFSSAGRSAVLSSSAVAVLTAASPELVKVKQFRT